MILLDTSVFIDYFRKSKKDKTLLHKLLSSKEKFEISVVTHFEIMIGNTIEQNSFWEVILENISIFDYNFHLNTSAVEIQKQLKKISKSISFQDLIIAATAKTLGRSLATLNKKHFEHFDGLKLVTPENL